jgi:hypothetical protein
MGGDERIISTTWTGNLDYVSSRFIMHTLIFVHHQYHPHMKLRSDSKQI